MPSRVIKKLSLLPKNSNLKVENYIEDENFNYSKTNATFTALNSSKFESNYSVINSHIPPYVKNLMKNGKLREIREITNYKCSKTTDQYIYGINFTVENENFLKSFKKNFYIFNSKKKNQNNNLHSKLSRGDPMFKKKQIGLKNKVGILLLTRNNDEILVREYFLITLNHEISINKLGKYINVKNSYVPFEVIPRIYICRDSTFHISKMEEINKNKVFKLEKKTYYICLDYVDEILNSFHNIKNFNRLNNNKK